MPFVPKAVTMTKNTFDILNAIRNGSSTDYRNYIPEVESISEFNEIGTTLVANPDLRNEFINTLTNKLIFPLIRSKTYDNPLAIFKKGILGYGETIEESFIDLCKIFNYDPDTAESEVFKREYPEVKTVFHKINYQKFYKLTVSQADLRKAFMSETDFYNFIMNKVNSMYKSANYDEFLVMKYMLNRRILNGFMYPVFIDSTDIKKTVTAIKSASNKATFLNNKYNMMGVHNECAHSKQFIIVNSDFDAEMNVEVLASAFNMSKADFLSNRVLVDSFSDNDLERLKEIFTLENGEVDGAYKEFTADELERLAKIPCVSISDDYFMIYDNLFEMTSIQNPQGLYENRFLHTWKMFSCSPFETAIVFTYDNPQIDNVSVTGVNAMSLTSINDTLEVNPNFTIQYTATVTSSGFATKGVSWSVTDDKGATVEGVTISPTGVLIINKEMTAKTLKIKATSVFDKSKSGTVTLKIS